MAAPIGNKFGTKARIWTQAIERALSKRSKADQMEAIDALAEKLLSLCDAGDLQALKEFGDRVEGKPVATVDARADVKMEISWDDGREDTNPVSPEAPSA